MKKTINLDVITKNLSIIFNIMLALSMITITSAIAVYYTKGIEMFWLINTAVFVGGSTVLLFLVLIGTIIALAIQEQKEEEVIEC